MLAERRHQMILSIVRADGPVSITALVDRLGQSAATIRRDLIALDEEGLLKRVYGGAVPLPERDEPFAQVADVRVPEKEAVALACAEMVQDGQTVLLDIGTTALRVATHLRGRPITVITTNMAVFDELRDDDAVELVVLGGVHRRQYRSLVGFLAEDALRQVRADVLVLGTSGISPDGSVMDTTIVEVPIKRAMIAASERVVLAADASKFPGSGIARVCDAGALDVVVTEDGADPTTCAALRAAGVEVRRAHVVPAAAAGGRLTAV
ncbi:DeoR/GlpR family DNA-binding transcription regulator [Quadrisphaera oryzae]|uniref:DeoR/GlpR family DNA-binding transcription regulator n=1 Tax=Quadrisphaera TaxID=317661 RepID=UPI001649080D|nr:DeoR/GlpR family DNA-binding transcription regulator [Quadrisphaera sp. RL12-1S]MBC3763145.1 DeoR/GlpR transcriptional regulator [Quadrisphaera sp. RL12-1S]